MISIKNSKDIAAMKESADILKDTFKVLEESVKEGVSTLELDRIVHDYIKSRGAHPSFLNYMSYPASICASVDEVVVHGIPSKKIILKNGQIIGVDIGVVYNGYHSDCARTYEVGDVAEDKHKLVKVTEESFFKGLQDIKAGMRLGDISGKIQAHAESHGYSIVTALTGHGIGTSMHEDPSVPNYGKVGSGVRLQAGMALAIEPMVNMGVPEVDFMSDGWTVKTRDRKPSSHYENTVIILSDGVEILTL